MRRVFRIPFTRGHIDREIDDEFAFHLEARTRKLIAAGWAADAAHREAIRQFGDLASVRESCVELDRQRERAMHRAYVWSELRQDTAFALRTLRRNFGVTALIVTALAVGIGANTAIFTLVDAVLVAKLPVHDPDALVAIGDPARVGSMNLGVPPVTSILSYPLYKDLRQRNHVFSDVLASGRSDRLDVRIDQSATELEHPRGRFVSGNYFSLLGVHAALGRTFDASVDANPGASPVITISYGYWMRRFHGDRDVIGKQLVVAGMKMTIIGVAEREFTGDIVGTSNDMWLPISMVDVLRPNLKRLDDRSVSWLLLLGRLKPGATLEQAQRELPPLIEQSVVENSTPLNAKSFLGAKPKYFVSSGAKGFSAVRETFQAPLVTLLIGVALLLCIICANVANLLLARSITRGRELSVRLALGAGRARLVRQLLTEAGILAAISAAVGLLIAWWASRALLTLAASGIPFTVNVSLDARVLGFTLVVTIGSVVLFGLVPAFRASRVDVASSIRASASSISAAALGGRGQRAPLGTALIAGQVALSVVLLVGAGMLVQSLQNVESQDVGLDRDHLLIAEPDIITPGYQLARLANVAHEVRDRIAALPGVAAVTYSENGIFSGTENGTTIEVPGFVARKLSDTVVYYDHVGPGYVGAIGAHLLAGRDILPSDEGRLARVATVNQALANFFFPGQSAVGKFLHLNDSIAIQIVGVVADVRDHDLVRDVQRRMYFPFATTDTEPGQVSQPGALRFAIRTTGNPADLVQPVRRAIRSVDPSLPVNSIRPLSDSMARSISQQRLLAQIAAAFGVLALLLAAVGLYGVMTYAISRRTSEIGLRVALGAERANILRMVLVDALRLVVIGLAIGIPLALASARLLVTQLHGVSPADPLSIGVAVVVLASAAVVAALRPAVRASRVAPIVALRAE
jgi:predicted permease